MADSFIAIDAGNTHLTWGLFVGEELVQAGRLSNRQPWPLPFAGWDAASVWIASVSQQSSDRLRAQLTPAVEVGGGELVFLGDDRPILVDATVPYPEQAGADRLLNALGWHRRRSAPAVIIDFGTAITFDMVSAQGDYEGGLILPGPGLIARSLDLETSLLPHVEIEPVLETFGVTTQAMIRRGVYGLLRGGVEFHLRELRALLGPETVFAATGGGAPIYAPWFQGIELILPYLTLEGIWVARRKLES